MTQSTGEHFLMREPQVDDAAYLARWRSLADTLERLGATVTRMPAQTDEDGLALGFYVRDAGIPVHVGDQLSFFVARDSKFAQRQESDAVKQQLSEDGHILRARTINGRVEGGNVVFDPEHNVMFWNISSGVHLKNEDERTEWTKHRVQEQLGAHTADAGALEQMTQGALEIEDEGRALRRDRELKPQQDALDDMQSRLGADNPHLERNGRPLSFVPLAIKDEYAREFYHLDGALGMLPGGQAVLCRELFSSRDMLAIERAIGRSNIIPISLDEARAGATNFITVGDHLVTPYASPALKQRFEKLGYDVVDPPSVGLKEGDWMFGPMGAVRCATLKTTPDIGFPEPARGKGVV